MSSQDSKAGLYRQLVQARKACRVCVGLTNPSICEGGCFDGDEIGSWSGWQGNLDAEVMVVGQDWGDVRWFVAERGQSTNTSRTNTTLVQLLGEAGIRIGLPRETSGRGTAFFTNAILCLKDGGAQAAVRATWFQNCGVKFLRPLIELVRPRVVVGLGERAYRGILRAYDLRAGRFSDEVRRKRPVELSAGTFAFAVYHCGARTQNINRSLDVQLRDWRRIGAFLGHVAG